MPLLCRVGLHLYRAFRVAPAIYMTESTVYLCRRCGREG